MASKAQLRPPANRKQQMLGEDRRAQQAIDTYQNVLTAR
ncbi:hypothetical protein SAMN05444746_12268 [Variovorax sp. OK212]|nr:hypothetical protein SAMN05518853_12268 [Variovorax sp. OK202]SFE36588.1 hypothetical protein SAMN05444746_12268 [Variovorax sp. OK212]